MITVSPAAAVCGAVLGIGLWLVIFRSPLMRAMTLTQRIEPQLKSQNLESRLLSGEHTLTPFGPLERILRPFIRDGISALREMSPAPGATARRLALAGISKSVTDFHAEQVIWAAAGFALTSAIVAVGAAAGRFNALLAAVAIIGSGVGALLFGTTGLVCGSAGGKN